MRCLRPLGVWLNWRRFGKGALFRSLGLGRVRFLRVSYCLGRFLFLLVVLRRIERRKVGLVGRSDAWLCAFCSTLACSSEVLSVFSLLKIVGGLRV